MLRTQPREGDKRCVGVRWKIQLGHNANAQHTRFFNEPLHFSLRVEVATGRCWLVQLRQRRRLVSPALVISQMYVKHVDLDGSQQRQQTEDCLHRNEVPRDIDEQTSPPMRRPIVYFDRWHQSSSTRRRNREL